MTNTMIVCGLTEWEQETVRKHKGECKYCMYHECFMTRCFNGEKIPVFVCTKDGKEKRFNEVTTGCEDWVLDTR